MNNGKLIYAGTVGDMKKLIQRNVVDLALAGDIDSLSHTMTTEEEGFRCERVNVDVLRVFFVDGRDFAIDLTRMLEIISRHGVEVIAIRSAGEIEDAFLKRLEDDRLKGFSRAFEG